MYKIFDDQNDEYSNFFFIDNYVFIKQDVPGEY